MGDVPGNVGQSKLSAEMVERQTFVINAQSVENGGVQIVNVQLVFGDEVAELVS